MIDLALEAASRGRTVHMVVVNHRQAVIRDLAESVRLIDLDRSRVAFALPALWRYLRENRPKALIATIGHTNVLAVLAARLIQGTRVVVREANTVGEDQSGSLFKRWAVRTSMRYAYRGADAIVAVSDGVATSIVEQLGVREDRVQVILNPVITPRVLSGAEEPIDHEWFCQDAPPVVLGVGRLVEQKAFDTLMRAFAVLRASQECRLVILGEGRLRGSLQQLAEELGIENDVAMPGFVDNPFKYMANAGLFVLSSRWEGLPNALIQAMAVGCRVVTTDCPSGPREVTNAGELAPLVAVDDVTGLAEAMSKALSAPAPQLSEQWFARYSLVDVATEYLAVLEEGQEPTP